MKSIVIADSHAVCRDALCSYIRHSEPEYEIEEIDNYAALRARMRLDPPDLVLLDQGLPGVSKEAIDRDFRGDIKMAMIVPGPVAIETLDPYVLGVFSKKMSSKNFAEGIRQIFAGKPFYPSLISDYMERVPAMFAEERRGPEDFGLTAREREVMSYLLKGASNKDIARALNLQVVTVKLHVRGLCRKMKAANRTQAAIIAKENGWG